MHHYIAPRDFDADTMISRVVAIRPIAQNVLTVKFFADRRKCAFKVSQITKWDLPSACIAGEHSDRLLT